MNLFFRKTVLSCLLGACLGVYAGEAQNDLGLFKGKAGTEPPQGWSAQFHPDIPSHTDLRRVKKENGLILQVQSASGYGSWAYQFDSATPVEQLSWNWRVFEKPKSADLKTKTGDDAAIKLCVFVAIDESRLGLGTRLALGAARTLSGENLPAATLCYLWAGQPYKGQTFANPYTDRVRNVILRDEPADGVWLNELRDVKADVIKAFGDELPMVNQQPEVRLLGLAIGGDADNTQSQSLAELKALHVR